MAKLYFRYGAMNSGKTTSLLQVAHNYEENGRKVIILKSKIDTKADDCIISRIGPKRRVDKLVGDERLYPFYPGINLKEYSAILVDEAQFLKDYQIEDLYIISKIYDIPVICYGLRADFRSNSFEGSKRLFELADEFEELVTICNCGKKAKFNCRNVNGEFVKEGEQILIEDENCKVKYIPLCGECFVKKVMKIENECTKDFIYPN